jgi:hypothetical protein
VAVKILKIYMYKLKEYIKYIIIILDILNEKETKPLAHWRGRIMFP